jgi:hypothetical protein
MCDVVGAAIAYKIVKIDYIALQCKSLIIKEELTIKINEGNGDGIGAHEVVSTVG